MGAGGGTTAGGAFRFQYQHDVFTESLRNELQSLGVSDTTLGEWAYMQMDRDRAIEDYLTVAAATAGSFFDAVVDGNLSASEPGNRIYIGIGEAVQALGVLGLTNVTIGVKPLPAGTSYQETADLTTNIPARVRLIGGGHNAAVNTISTNPVTWDLRGRDINFTDITIENISIRHTALFSNGAGDMFNSSTLANLVLINCQVTANSTSGRMMQLNGVSNDTRIVLYNTVMFNMAYGRARWVYHNGGEMAFSTAYTFTTVMQPSASPTGGDAVCVLVGVQLSSLSATTNVTWNNANSEAVIFVGCSVTDRGFMTLIPSAGRLNLTFVGRPCIEINNSSATNSTNVTVTFSNTTGGSSCTIKGACGANSGTIQFTKTGTNPCRLQGDLTAFDVTGPARVDTTHNTTTGVTSGILRGAGIVADVEMNSSNTGTALQLIGVTHSVVRAAFRTATTLSKAWSLDATSNNNICDFAGASIATNPGTDAGAGNLIRQT